VFLRKFLLAGIVIYCLGVGFVNGHFWQSEEKLLRHVRSLEKEEFTVAYEQLPCRYDNNEKNVQSLIGRAPSAVSRSVWLKDLAIFTASAGLPARDTVFE